MKRSLCFLLALVPATLVGCQGHTKLEIANIKGTVTVDGKPVEKGTITFFGTDEKVPLVADIIDGKYTGAAVVGQNKVMISARRKTGHAPKLSPAAEAQYKGYKEWMKDKTSGPIEFDPTMVEIIPPEFGSNSKQTRVVEPGKMNEFDFDIKTAH